MAEVNAELIQELDPELRTRDPGPWLGFAAKLGAAGLAVYSLYWTQFPVTPQVYRASFLAVALVLGFLSYSVHGRVGLASAVAIVAGGFVAAGAYLQALPVETADKHFFIYATGAAALLSMSLAWRAWRKERGVPLFDLALAAVSAWSLIYLILNFEDALQRITSPTPAEVLLGLALIVVTLEATRRTSGLALPITALIVLAYGLLGPYVPEPFDHRGYGLSRIIGQNYLTLEGIFGVPLDVAASFIVLFTVYGAVLEYSGAGQFFLDWSFAALGGSRAPAAVGRAVTLAGFLFGTVSGSGVATTVTLGTLAWPMLKNAGYEKEEAGGLLASAGLGAILSPPTLGAAAFLIAEYLKITYLDVLVMAMVPTILYYASCFFMIQGQAPQATCEASPKAAPSRAEARARLLALTLRSGYHFSSLFVVAVLMATGLSVFMAVYWAIFLAFALSFLRPETRASSSRAAIAGIIAAIGTYLTAQMTAPAALFVGFGVTLALAAYGAYRKRPDDRRLYAMLASGGKGALSVTATTATAGVIVSIVTLTGLGLKISGLIVDLSLGVPALVVVYSAISVLVLGLAVPVTASYIIAAVMVVPALVKAGVDERAAHMFVFYYAVLSDVSPPTALSPYAAAAITGGRPFGTMVKSWAYCLPAFLVPFVFCLDENGLGLLLLAPAPVSILVSLGALIAVVFIAWAISGHVRRRLIPLERMALLVSGVLLLVPRPLPAALGLGLAVPALWRALRRL